MNGIVEPIAVYFEDMDPLGMLHNSKYINLFERAHTNYWARAGWAYDPVSPRFKEMLFVVKENSVTYHKPILRTGTVHVRMWVDKLGNTSVIYGFQALSEDEAVLHAEGRRVIVRVDPETGRPASIPQEQRDAAGPLLRDAPVDS